MNRYRPLILSLSALLVLTGATGVSAQMKVSSGTSLVVTTGAQLNLADISLDFGDATLLGGGKLRFSGMSNSELTGMTPVGNVVLAKVGGRSLRLGSNLAVSGSVDFVSGYLELNGFDLALGTTGLLLNERNDSYVSGAGSYVSASGLLNAPSGANLGNLGLSISSTANLGNTLIRRGHDPISDGAHQSIRRFFEVSPANNVNLEATLRFRYLDRELNGLQEGLLRLMRSQDNGLTWSGLDNGLVDAAQDFVEVTGVNSLGKLSLINEFTLPLSSLKLAAKVQKRGVNLQWLTVNEVEVDRFLAEKSYDGKRFLTFSELRSKSAVSPDNSYAVDDLNPLLGMNYYRITAVDRDGKTSQSNIIPINFSLAREEQASLYPNPAVRTLNGTFYMGLAQQVKLTVVSSLGRVELSRVVQATAGLNHFSFDVGSLASGAYVVQIATPMINQQLKFIKN